MLTVVTLREAAQIIEEAFPPRPSPETVPLETACSRVLYAPVEAAEYVPGFDRSTVDGYAVRASDTFGCSDALPALLTLAGTVEMGAGAGGALAAGSCVAVPTGGAIPPGADAAVMLEDTEDYGDGTVGICKSAAPGMNLIFRGDDVRPGQAVLEAGRRLSPQDIGALAALGAASVAVCRRPVAGILSTGDELVPVGTAPGAGQVRDVNSEMLRALVESAGAQAVCCGIVRDDEAALRDALDQALSRCDLVLISGGSSVGAKDATERVVSEQGTLLFHGLAVKPGKPTILGNVRGKPVFGLPGHPVAALFISRLLVLPLLERLMGCVSRRYPIPAAVTESVSANHGRAQLMGVRLFEEGGKRRARPIRGKSGLITTLAGADGYFEIPREREGVAAGEEIDVYLF